MPKARSWTFSFTKTQESRDMPKYQFKCLDAHNKRLMLVKVDRHLELNGQTYKANFRNNENFAICGVLGDNETQEDFETRYKISKK